MIGRLAPLVLVACATARPAVRELPGSASLVDPASGPFVAAERFRGHVVVLDFWAGWCDECKRTMPQVARLAAALAPQGLVVLGVNAGDPPADAASYARDLGIPYPIVLDPELAFSDRLDAANIPVLLVIDKHGAIAHRTRHVDEATLAVIRKLLAEP